jgi:hypothetical protein
MTPRKKENALGKGLDALIRTDYLDEEKSEPIREEKEAMLKESVKEKETSTENKKSSKKEDSGVTESKKLVVDDKIVEDVLLEVHKNPRISLWSAKSAAVLRFLKKTKPEFSISNEASLLIEEAVKERHPEIWDLFQEKGL